MLVLVARNRTCALSIGFFERRIALTERGDAITTVSIRAKVIFSSKTVPSLLYR